MDCSLGLAQTFGHSKAWRNAGVSRRGPTSAEWTLIEPVLLAEHGRQGWPARFGHWLAAGGTAGRARVDSLRCVRIERFNDDKGCHSQAGFA